MNIKSMFKMLLSQIVILKKAQNGVLDFNILNSSTNHNLQVIQPKQTNESICGLFCHGMLTHCINMGWAACYLINALKLKKGNSHLICKMISPLNIFCINTVHFIAITPDTVNLFHEITQIFPLPVLSNTVLLIIT